MRGGPLDQQGGLYLQFQRDSKTTGDPAGSPFSYGLLLRLLDARERPLGRFGDDFFRGGRQSLQEMDDSNVGWRVSL